MLFRSNHNFQPPVLSRTLVRTVRRHQFTVPIAHHFDSITLQSFVEQQLHGIVHSASEEFLIMAKAFSQVRPERGIVGMAPPPQSPGAGIRARRHQSFQPRNTSERYRRLSC